MPYRERVVPSLARWVECVWSHEAKQDVCGYSVLPDGCIDIIYTSGELHVVGAMSREKRFDLRAQAWTVGVRFQPGMAGPFLRVPAQQITDRTVPLDCFWDSAARELQSRLSESRSADDCCNVLAAALAPPDSEPNQTQRAVEAITAAQGDVDMEWIIRQTGVTGRHFRRRLLEETGLSPKKLCRVLRFRRALALGRKGLPWSLVAVDAGYFDQAHLIRDFREFAGSTPMSVFSNTLSSDRS